MKLKSEFENEFEMEIEDMQMSNYNVFNDADEWSAEKLIKDIDKIKTKLKIKEQEIEDEKYIYNLIYDDYVRFIKTPKNFYDYIQDVVIKAFSEQHEKLKKDRKNYEVIKDHIISDFFCGEDKNCKVIEIISGGYEGYNYEWRIEYKDSQYEVQIPILKNLNRHNIDYAGYGKIRIFETHKSCSTLIAESYVVEELTEFMKNNLENKSETT